METKIDNMKSETIDAMFKAGAHFGYPKSRRHPSVRSYIFGAKNRTEIIDLEQVKSMLETAEAYVRTLGAMNKQIIFVGNKPEAKVFIERAALELGQPYAKERWIGGTLTNWVEIKKRITRMEDLADRKAKGELSIYPKKEIILMDRELVGLRRFFSGLAIMKSLPAALFVIDPRKEVTAMSEARKLGIPVVALAGSDNDISGITYPIVANDASIASIEFFVERIKNAYLDGRKTAVEPTKETTSNDNNGSDQGASR